MLSKSQARLFFLSMTGGFTAVFLWLTIDTVRAVPEREHADKRTDQVIRGKAIWEDNNCMGCHTLLGEGAYYAPELTKVVERRGKVWIDTFLQDPEAMYPGRRKMVKYDFTAEQRADVIAFLEWVGNIDTNGFPAKPDMAPPASGGVDVPAEVMASAPAVVGTTCKACHAVDGEGGNVGPALVGLSKRYTPAQLDAWLRDPTSVKPGTSMPNLNLPDSERAALVSWLLTLP